jgi:transcriptional regulator with GAF, ATPase, and Fis domain
MTASVTLAHSGSEHPGRVLEIARCALLSLNGPRRGEEVIIDRECFRIGKSPDNDLVLLDETVSRDHCEIVRDDKGYLLRDLGSTNGTLLDGAEIREGYLRAGVVIRVGRVPAMREVFGLLERLAPTDATLLVGGETGTGKDLLARAAHAASPRAKHPFIVVDCGAVVGTLIESELFGHEKGAFTGAVDTRKGAFELAHKGTLFLDEIGELPLSLQPKLLRALESRRIRRVGSEREIPIDIRVIAASHRNLRLEVERGKFREDLYFRLAVVPLHLPPLRERRDDVPLIAEQLLTRLSEPGPTPLTISKESLAALRAHDWPGNVRELRNVLERAALMSRAAGETEVRLLGMPALHGSGLSKTSAPLPANDFDPARSYRETREIWETEFERRYVSWLLSRHSGNVSSAAREADMDRKHLHKLAKKHGLRGD